MSSSNPPYPNFNGITYNSSFFSTISGGLTQGQANLLYLRKTYADTATATETFGAGIASDTLGSTSGTLSLGANDIINIGTGSSRGSKAVSINTNGTGNVNLGGNIGQAVQFFGTSAGVNLQFDRINQSDPTQTFNLCNTQTSGILNIATGLRNLSGVGGGINIGTGSGAVNVPITIGSTGSLTTINGSTLNIGNGFSTTNLNGNSIISNLAINAVQRSTNGTLLLGTTSTSTEVDISQTGITTKVLGALSVAQATTLTGLTTAPGGIKSNSYDINLLSPSELGIGSSVTTDTVRIAENITTGTIAIGNGSACNGTCSIMGSGTSARTISVGSTLATSTINLNGNVTLSKPLILGIVPTASTQLGYTTSGTLSNNTGGPGNYLLGSLTIPTVGVYIISFVIQLNCSALPTSGYIQLQFPNTPPQLVFSPSIGPNFGYSSTVLVSPVIVCSSGSFTTSVTTAGILNLQNFIVGAGITGTSLSFIATRIA
jgi:hypothetical protein